jgi:hypothetical protein
MLSAMVREAFTKGKAPRRKVRRPEKAGGGGSDGVPGARFVRWGAGSVPGHHKFQSIQNLLRSAGVDDDAQC